MALMFAICRPQPNWTPRKPTLMFQPCQTPSLGFSIGPPVTAGILLHKVRGPSKRVGGVAIEEAERAREAAIRGVASDVDAPPGVEVMALDERHPETRERLAAPADGWPV